MLTELILEMKIHSKRYNITDLTYLINGLENFSQSTWLLRLDLTRGTTIQLLSYQLTMKSTKGNGDL